MTPITTSKILGRVLRKNRRELGLTQSQVGSKFNIRQASISKIESGSGGVSIDTVFRLLSALNLEMSLQSRDSHSSDKELW
jgi:HTH-type transcriptional regulator/antitoxin HipB